MDPNNDKLSEEQEAEPFIEINEGLAVVAVTCALFVLAVGLQGTADTDTDGQAPLNRQMSGGAIAPRQSRPFESLQGSSRPSGPDHH